MWTKFSHFIINNRLSLILIIGLITALMASQALRIEMDYSMAKIMPADHEIIKDFNAFQKQFGDDANTFIIGLQARNLFSKEILNDWQILGKQISELEGITGLLSVPEAVYLNKNSDQKRFELRHLIEKPIISEEEADSLEKAFEDLAFYENRIFNAEKGATLMAISIDSKILDTQERTDKINEILATCESFQKKHNVELKYSGLPYLRNYRVTTIARELVVFLVLAFVLMVVLLTLLFRSLSGVLLPMLVVTIGVIWVLGTVVLFGFKVNILTGLIPSLIIIIGIPNCVYLLNKYHLEFKKTDNQQQALLKSIEKIGNVTFYANLTTAIGFGVFAITKSQILREFGLVAGLNVFFVFIISIIVLPVIISYLAPPKREAIDYLEFKLFRSVIKWLKNINLNYRKLAQIATVFVVIAALIGLTKLESRGYIFDDIPHKTKSYQDLKFLEDNFTGVVPLEVIIDTKKKGGVTQISVLNKIERIQQNIKADPEMANPISITEGLKMATQAYYGGKKSRYQLPSSLDKNLVFAYLGKMERGVTNDLLNSFMDKDRRLARISFQMKDIGSKAFPEKLAWVKEVVEKEFDPSKYDITYTGTGLVSLTGYNYLVDGLIYSVMFAFILIAIIMSFLFKSARMLLIAIIPNLIPLLITAGIMGYFKIYLKPSTVLIFSVAYGISVDFTIHFLAKYRLELSRHNWDVQRTVFAALEETGFSMLYTAMVLLSGFAVFLVSSFEGTIYLGMLTCITLVVSLLANLVLLPGILLTVKPSREIQRMQAELKELEKKD